MANRRRKTNVNPRETEIRLLEGFQLLNWSDDEDLSA